VKGMLKRIPLSFQDFPVIPRGQGHQEFAVFSLSHAIVTDGSGLIRQGSVYPGPSPGPFESVSPWKTISRQSVSKLGN